MRLVIAGVLLVAASTGANANGYADFNTGVALRNHDEYASAVTYLSRALSAPDLPAHLREPALLARGLAYNSLKNHVLAEADFTAAIQLDPKLITGHMFRADTEEMLKKYDAAISDYSSVIALKPFLVEAYVARGSDYEMIGKYAAAEADFAYYTGIETNSTVGFFQLAFSQWLQGNNEKAEANFEQAFSVDKTNDYAVLWREIVALSTGGSSELRSEARKLDNNWPRPVIDLFLGKAKPDEVNAAAAKGDANVIKDQQCDAAFYVGEWQLLHQKDSAQARTLFNQALVPCADGIGVEELAARTELGRIPAIAPAAPVPAPSAPVAPNTPVASSAPGTATVRAQP